MTGFWFHCSSCQNSLETGADKPAGDTQRLLPANDSDSSLPFLFPVNSHISTPTAFCTPMLASAFVPAPALVSAPASMLAPAKYINADFLQCIKVFMDVQRHSKTHEGSQKDAFKACFPNLYNEKSHMDYYQFC